MDDNKIRLLQAEITRIRIQYDEAIKSLENWDDEITELQVDIDALKADLNKLSETVNDFESNIAAAMEQAAKAESAADTAQTTAEAAQTAANAANSAVSALDDKLTVTDQKAVTAQNKANDAYKLADDGITLANEALNEVVTAKDAINAMNDIKQDKLYLHNILLETVDTSSGITNISFNLYLNQKDPIDDISDFDALFLKYIGKTGLRIPATGFYAKSTGIQFPVIGFSKVTANRFGILCLEDNRTVEEGIPFVQFKVKDTIGGENV